MVTVNQPSAVSSIPRPLASVHDLSVAFRTRSGDEVLVLDGASVEVYPGRAIGVVGESGSGKTMMCRALVGLMPRLGGRIVRGSIRHGDEDLTRASEERWRRIRGPVASFIPQSSLVGLNPVLNVEAHLRETVEAGPAAARTSERVTELLEMVRLPTRVRRLRGHELSGGMRQRVMIALALATEPSLLIADEPTTALDVTIQRGILDTLAELQERLGLALLLVSHDLAIIEDVCDEVAVMYAGATVDIGATHDMITRPSHPYTAALQRSRIDHVAPGSTVEAVAGETPPVGRWPSGCRFRPRCAHAIDSCAVDPQPPLRWVGERQTACLRFEDIESHLVIESV